jgi:uncharacterized protein YndB with AHSA1/START domain
MSTATPGNPASSPNSLVVERVFSYPPEKIWRALTESTILAQWMLPNDFAPIAGGKFQFQTEPRPNWNGTIHCEVVVVEPQKRLTYNWVVGAGFEWAVEWTLTPAEGGTRLRMEQSGFKPDQKPNYNGARYGWKKFFDGLESVLGGAL